MLSFDNTHVIHPLSTGESWALEKLLEGSGIGKCKDERVDVDNIANTSENKCPQVVEMCSVLSIDWDDERVT